MSTPPQRPEDWTPEALDRLRAALKAMPEPKGETAHPSKADGGDDR
jgi:hypothetical protein